MIAILEPMLPQKTRQSYVNVPTEMLSAEDILKVRKESQMFVLLWTSYDTIRSQRTEDFVDLYVPGPMSSCGKCTQNG